VQIKTENLDFLNLGGPGRPGNTSKGWGAKPPIFLNGFSAAQTLKIQDSPS
jgi:hypothetical protein